MSQQRSVNRPASAEGVIPFAPVAKDAVSDSADPVDATGQSILGLLNRAADMAEQNSRHALDVAHRLSIQLEEAEGRIHELESHLRYHQARADRAEKWLYQISVEIEDKFFNTKEAPPSQVPSPQSILQTRGRRTAT
jgi:hypothetical protein